MAKWAALCAPASIGSKSTHDDELLTAITGITQQYALPLESQLAWFHRVLKGKLAELKATWSEVGARDLWEFIRPEAVDIDPKAATDWSSPGLFKIAEDVALKCKRWLAIIIDFLCHLLSLGETGRVKLQTFMDMLREQMRQVLAEDIDDAFVSAVTEVGMILEGLYAIMADDLHLHLQGLKRAEELQALMRTTSSKPAARVANSLAATQYWAGAVQSYFARCSAVKVHASRLEKVKAALTWPNVASDQDQSTTW